MSKSKRVIKIISLFKLAKESETKSEGILIDRQKFLDALKGLGKSNQTVKIAPVTV